MRGRIFSASKQSLQEALKLPADQDHVYYSCFQEFEEWKIKLTQKVEKQIRNLNKVTNEQECMNFAQQIIKSFRVQNTDLDILCEEQQIPLALQKGNQTQLKTQFNKLQSCYSANQISLIQLESEVHESGIFHYQLYQKNYKQEKQ